MEGPHKRKEELQLKNAMSKLMEQDIIRKSIQYIKTFLQVYETD